MASVSCAHITHWKCTRWCLALISTSGSRPGHRRVATRSHSCLPELFTTHWEPLALHSRPTRQEGLSDFRSDAPGRGQGGRGLGLSYRCCFLFHVHLVMGWPGPNLQTWK